MDYAKDMLTQKLIVLESDIYDASQNLKSEETRVKEIKNKIEKMNAEKESLKQAIKKLETKLS